MKRYTGYSGIQKFSGDYALSPDLHLKYRLIGEWTRANYMMQRFPHLVVSAVNLATRKIAVRYRRQVIKNIQNSGAELGWEPSDSVKYKAYKAKHSVYRENQHWQFFGALLSNIRTFKRGRLGWSAGIQEGEVNPQMEALKGGKNTLTIAEYAGVLEHGSPKRNIKARPLWIPSYRQIGGNPALTKQVAFELRKKFPRARLRLPQAPGRAEGLSTMNL